MKKMFKELSRFKLQIVLLIITVLLSTLANLSLPMYLSEIINKAVPTGDVRTVLSIGAKMILLAFIGIFCSIISSYISAKVSSSLGKNIRHRIFVKVESLSQAEMDKFTASSLITRTTNDVTHIQTFFSFLLRIALMAPLMFVGGVFMSLAKSPQMSMILLVSMPILLFFVYIVGKKVMPISVIMQEKLDNINLIVREKLTGIRVARTFSTEIFEEERFEKVNEEFMKNATAMYSTMVVAMPGMNLILYGTTLALVFYGGNLIVKGSPVPVGDIIAVVQYVTQILISVLMLSMIFMIYPRTATSAKRISEVLETEPSISGVSSESQNFNQEGCIEFKNVSFTFPNANSPAIKNISFCSKAGEVTAIIGSTGSGKSTLINLIPRFYDTQCGEILIDGVNIKDLGLDNLRKKIGLVPQKAFLFKGTVKQNVEYGKNISEEDTVRALKIAQAYDFVMEKEGGIYAEITQGATNVSGGQKQRLAIARAVAKRPEIYIFDDSFSALDYKTDVSLRRELLKETKNSTVILVAQRVSTIKNADKIIVLENGEIVGVGKHDELQKNCEVYREIVYSQLGKDGE